MKSAVLGAGAWGTALSKLLAEKGGTVSLWSRRRDLCNAVNESGENQRYLPGVKLPRAVTCVSDVSLALEGAETIVLAVPSHAMREVARAAAPYMQRGAPVISATKGIETESLMFMDEVLAQEVPPHSREKLAFLSGPSFASELAFHMPTAVVIAAHDEDVCAEVVQRLRTPYLRAYASDDVAGVECGGALKNVIAIASGAVQGMGFGHNTRAALLTRGLAENARLATARGGSAMTLAGLAGMGDLVLTCTGELSRNRTLGYELGQGRKLADVLANLGHVAEGVTTAKSAHELSKRLAVDMPITSEVYAVLYRGKPAEQAVEDLMARELGYEFDRRALARPHPSLDPQE